MKINIILIEPAPYKRLGIISALSQDPEFNVVGSGGNLVEAIDNWMCPDDLGLLIANIDCRAMEDMKVWALLRSTFPKLRIIVLTNATRDDLLEIALIAGVNSIQPHDISPRELCEVVKDIMKGGKKHNSEIIEKIKFILMKSEPRHELRIGNYIVEIQDTEERKIKQLSMLSTREKQVLSRLVRAKTNKQIARELQITVRTAEFHVTNIIKKLGVASRYEAGILAMWLLGSPVEPEDLDDNPTC